MQIVNQTDKKVVFAGAEIEPKSSISLHKSFIKDDDLKREDVEQKGNIIFIKKNEDIEDIIDDLSSMHMNKLKKIAKDLGIDAKEAKTKEELIEVIKAKKGSEK